MKKTIVIVSLILLGGASVYAIKTYKDCKKLDASNNDNECTEIDIFDDEAEAEIEIEIETEIEKDSCLKKLDQVSSNEDVNNNGDGVSLKSTDGDESSSRETTCDDREKSNRKFVLPEQSRKKEYSSLSEASKAAKTDILLVKELGEGNLEVIESNKEELENASNNKLDETKDEVSEVSKDYVIKPVSVIVFAKAVAQGALMKSFVFDPVSKSFYWNFINQKMDNDEIVKELGKDIVNQILEESSTNANGWIQPRYLYDSSTDYYIKVESSVMVV